MNVEKVRLCVSLRRKQGKTAQQESKVFGLTNDAASMLQNSSFPGKSITSVRFILLTMQKKQEKERKKNFSIQYLNDTAERKPNNFITWRFK